MLLRKSYDVSWVLEKPYAELVQIVAGANVLPVRLKKWSLARLVDARQSVRDFPVAVDFQGLIKSALLTRASGAPERYGFAKEVVREKPAAWFYNHKIHVDRSKHVVDWNNELAAAVTGDLATGQGGNWSAYPRDPQNRLEKYANKIVILPGAGRMEKIWPFERFREVVKKYRDDAVVVWGPEENDLARAIGGSLAPETNLRELAFILKHAKLVIGGDTGPLHLADALGTKVIGLYGPTDGRRNGPYGQPQRTIQAASMQAITVEDVMRKIGEVLNE